MSTTQIVHLAKQLSSSIVTRGKRFLKQSFKESQTGFLYISETVFWNRVSSRVLVLGCKQSQIVSQRLSNGFSNVYFSTRVFTQGLKWGVKRVSKGVLKWFLESPYSSRAGFSYKVAKSQRGSLTGFLNRVSNGRRQGSETGALQVH